MNIGVVGKYLEDIKLILNISSLFKSNYFYCLNKDDESLNNIIDYLINNHNIDILIILTTKNINYIKKQYKNIFIINMTDVLFNYVNDFDYYSNLLILSDNIIKNNNINYINIENLISLNYKNIIKYVKNNIINEASKYKYLLSLNSKINEVINGIDINTKIIDISTPIKYILNKYSKETILSNMVLYTTGNKYKLKKDIKEKYNMDINVNFINNDKKYLVNIDEFSGPLDLLLHLIKESNIDICDINIFQITNQYLSYIKKMEDMNLVIASSYLVMASELMYLKSSILLPNREKDEEIEEEEFTKEDLINKLIEYKKYKEVANDFKNLYIEGSKYITKLPEKIEIVDNDKIKSEYNLNDLVNAFNKFLMRKIDEEPLSTTVTKKEYSVNDRCNSIKKILKEKKKITFIDLFDNYNKPYIIVSFLSVLEMLKSGEIYLIQNNIFEKIEIGIRDEFYE